MNIIDRWTGRAAWTLIVFALLYFSIITATTGG